MVPGPPFGSLAPWATRLAFLARPLPYMERLYRNYGDVAGLFRGCDDWVFAFSPQLTRVVLEDAELFHNPDGESAPLRMPEDSALRRLFAGLTTMNGARHRRLRSLVLGSLHQQGLASYRDGMVPEIEATLKRWRAGEQVDLHDEMRKLTLAIAVRCLIGVDPAREGSSARRLLEEWMRLVFSIPAIALPVDVPGLPFHRLLAVSERLEREFRCLIDEKRSAEGVRGDDVLAALIDGRDDDGAGLSEDELVGQTAFLFIAGHATTASVLTWSLLLLAAHPDLLDEVGAEVDEVVGDGVPQLDECNRLTRLDAVIRETMRLLPPVLWWSRLSTDSFALGPYEFSKGTRVVFSPYITHRIPTLYPSPALFDPSRWFGRRASPYSFIPFSGGQRGCLGSAFAMLEAKLVLAMLLRRFGIRLPSPTRVDVRGMILCEPKGAVPLTVTRRGEKHGPVELSGSISRYVSLPTKRSGGIRRAAG